jgi:CRP-like cAMP-binding protein
MDARDAVQHMTLFRGAAPADADAIAAIAEPCAYAAGEHLFDHLHPADALFAILIGMVEVTVQGKDLPIVTVGSGQSLGDLAFFERGTYGAAAYAREATRVLRIPFDGLDRLIAERAGLALVFYRNAATQFAHHMRQLAAERDRPYL